MQHDVFTYPLQRIGIIGGGQLGKMTAQAAQSMGFEVNVLDSSAQCPAMQCADKLIVGELYDAKKLRALAEISDVLTYEIEHIDTPTLHVLQNEGYLIYPSPRVLAIIQDKYQQKQLLAEHAVPVPAFQAVDTLTPAMLDDLQFPIVQKARTGGYDGKGVVILKNRATALQEALPVPAMLEEYIQCTKELAIIVARSASGEMRCYPLVEMVFDERTNICDIVAAPARVNAAVAEQARQVAMQAVGVLKGVGVFGVEMFLTQDERVLVNEISPRPHNSGHYTIEACVTSQFEQLVRIVSGLPLGSTELLRPAAMLNLLGEPNYQGKPTIEGLHHVLNIPGAAFHLYGKMCSKPHRKMGHVTIVDDDLETALNKLQTVKNLLKIKAKQTLKEVAL